MSPSQPLGAHGQTLATVKLLGNLHHCYQTGITDSRLRHARVLPQVSFDTIALA